MRINKSLITLSSGGTASSVPWSGVTGTPTTLSGYGITDAVPSSRTLTINGTSYDLSANRTWTIATVPPTRKIMINDVEYDLSVDRAWNVGDYGTW